MNDRRISYVAVVDDDESVCRSFGRLLRMSGYQPVTYPSAEAFLGDTERPDFDCLILDIQLGGMSGLELKSHLVEAQDETPVIFITAQEDPEFRAEAEGYGCSGYFRKTDPGALVFEAIGKMVEARNRHLSPVCDGETPCHSEGPVRPE
jgi:FixJ family two-component response regulator